VELPQKIRVISLLAMAFEVLRGTFELASAEFIHENVGGLGAPQASAAKTRLEAGPVDIRQKANIILR
jgi:hypothetical protein